MNLLNLLTGKFRFSVSLFSSELFSLVSVSTTFDFSARLLDLFSVDASSFSLVISSSCSLNFSNSVAVVRTVKSFVSEIAVTFGCQLLSKLLASVDCCSDLMKPTMCEEVQDLGSYVECMKIHEDLKLGLELRNVVEASMIQRSMMCIC